MIFFDHSLLITLDVDKDFKEGSDVVFEYAAEHVNNLSIVMNSRTTKESYIYDVQRKGGEGGLPTSRCFEMGGGGSVCATLDVHCKFFL